MAHHWGQVLADAQNPCRAINLLVNGLLVPTAYVSAAAKLSSCCNQSVADMSLYIVATSLARAVVSGL